jgi:hypothetical protein
MFTITTGLFLIALGAALVAGGIALGVVRIAKLKEHRNARQIRYS